MPASPLLHPPPWSSPGSPRSPSPPSSYIPAGDPAAPVTHPSTPLILFPHLSQFKTLGSVPQTSCREPNFLTHSARARPGLATVPPGVSQGLVYSRYSTNASRRTGERMDVFMCCADRNNIHTLAGGCCFPSFTVEEMTLQGG